MATRKTFARGEILTAQDVNDYLNPSTADHLATAVAAGTTEITGELGKSTISHINFPPGRFTEPPIVTTTIYSKSGSVGWNPPRIASVTASGFDVLTNHGSSAINWIAVQM